MADDAPDIVFLRHGVTQWNAERRIQGQRDVRLSVEGQRQAAALASALRWHFPDITDRTFYASPLARARQTMGAVLETLGEPFDRVTFDERLKERSFGEWEGRRWQELLDGGLDPDGDPEAFFHWRPEEGGESLADVAERVKAFLDDMRSPALIVAHVGIYRVLLHLLNGLPPASVARLPMAQTRFCRFHDGAIDWFTATTDL